MRLRPDLTREELSQAAASLASLEDVRPEVSDEALRGLKFADVLPPHLARDTIALRLTDRENAQRIIAEPRQWFL